MNQSKIVGFVFHNTQQIITSRSSIHIAAIQPPIQIRHCKCQLDLLNEHLKRRGINHLNIVVCQHTIMLDS